MASQGRCAEDLELKDKIDFMEDDTRSVYLTRRRFSVHTLTNLQIRNLSFILIALSSLTQASPAQTLFGDDTRVERTEKATSETFKVPSTESIYGVPEQSPAFSMPNLNLTGDRSGSTGTTATSSSSLSDAPDSASASVSQEALNTPVQPVDRPAPWYRYMTLGADLSRELQESERKCLLPIVPTPPNLRAVEQKSRKDCHYVLLRAPNNERYGSYRTIYGHVFAKAGAVVFVANMQQTVRVFNLNGKEGHVLYKMNNGQLLCVGAGTEMVIAPSLENVSLNPPDGLARRGVTRLPKDGQTQLAFSQFSFDSFFELPEMKHFLSTQGSSSVEPLKKIVEQLNAIRGVANFRKGLEAGAVAKKPSAVPIAKAPAQAQPANTIRNQSSSMTPAQMQAKIYSRVPSSASIAPKAVSTQHAVVKQDNIAPREDGPGFRAKLRALGQKATDKIAMTHEKLQNLDARTDDAKKLPAAKPIRSAKPAPPVVHTEDLLTMTPRRRPAGSTSQPIIPRMTSDDASLPVDARGKIFSAEIEERKSQKYRKQAKRNYEFAKGGFLSPEQSYKMIAEAKQLEINATLADEKADKFRQEALQLCTRAQDKPM